MKNKILLALSILLHSFFFSCSHDEALKLNNAKISGQIINHENHETKTWLEIIYPDILSNDLPHKQIKIDSTGAFNYEISIASPALCWGIYNKWFPFVISPGDSLHLTIDANIWNDSLPHPVVKDDKYVRVNGTDKKDYLDIIEFQKWASDSIYNIVVR